MCRRFSEPRPQGSGTAKLRDMFDLDSAPFFPQILGHQAPVAMKRRFFAAQETSAIH